MAAAAHPSHAALARNSMMVSQGFFGPYPGEVVYAPFHRTGVFISTDGGEAWSLSNQNISDARIYRITLDPLNPNTLYLATFDHGVMKSTDGEFTRQNGPVELHGISVGSISFDPNDPHVVYFATSAHGVLRVEY
jgi:hypothetical protein